MYCDCCPTRRMDSFHPYLNQTLCSLGRYQIWEFSIHISPLGPISGVSQHLILLTLFFVPPHQLSVVLVSEKALQTWYYWEIPHHLCENFFINGLPVDITRIILPDLIPLCVTNRTYIQFFVFTTIEDTIVRTCVNLLYVQPKRANNIFGFVNCRGTVRSPLEASSLQVLVAPQIPYRKHHWLPFTVAFPVWCLIFFNPCLQYGYNIFL